MDSTLSELEAKTNYTSCISVSKCLHDEHTMANISLSNNRMSGSPSDTNSTSIVQGDAANHISTILVHSTFPRRS